ncbi:proline racemase family protein [Aquiluna sp.]|nr:proline racemase family protein [Aquiluna sp.]MDA8992687.1 proline racemase family protein [Aquiluna sp.]
MMSNPSLEISVIDYHTAGEPFRIVESGFPEISGQSVLDKRASAIGNQELEKVRLLLVNEPRGHADMYGGFIVEANDSGADFGVLFWHGDGYSTACGHGTIALGAWAVDTGRVTANPDGETTVTIDVPSGRVQAIVRQEAGVTTQISFKNIFSQSIAENVSVELASGKTVTVDVGYGGANYASLNVEQLGLTVEPKHLDELIKVGREIKWTLNESPESNSQEDPRLNGIYGTIIYEELAASASQLHQRNVTVYADGRVDRSPCGSGTATRIAQLNYAGKLTVAMTLIHDSIIGTRFTGRVATELTEHDTAGVIPVISGNAFCTGTSKFTLNEHDELGTGFSLR